MSAKLRLNYCEYFLLAMVLRQAQHKIFTQQMILRFNFVF